MSDAPKIADPEIWPECDCGVPFVHRRALVLFPKTEYRWVWQRDCKHPKKEVHEHRMMTADGPYEPEETPHE